MLDKLFIKSLAMLLFFMIPINPVLIIATIWYTWETSDVWWEMIIGFIIYSMMFFNLWWPKFRKIKELEDTLFFHTMMTFEE